MFWLSRPPYARWAAVAVLVGASVLFDLRGVATEALPFAARDLARGTAVTADEVEWRDVPRGLWEAPALDGKVAARAIGRGDPITATALADRHPPPDDWWSLELPLPEGTYAGQLARVVVDEPPLSTEAVVVSVFAGGAFASGSSGLVAVPADVADALARAGGRGAAVVLVAP